MSVFFGCSWDRQDETIQSIKEERRYVTRTEDCWMVYTSKEVGLGGVATPVATPVASVGDFLPGGPQWPQRDPGAHWPLGQT